MLKDHFECIDDRIMVGKKKVSVMCVKSFEKIEDNYKPKQFKPKDPY